MQKKIIALAIAAAFSAPAFADVTAYGVVDAAVANVSGDNQKSDTIAVSGGLATSRFGVKTVEDLNNGMKAVVVLEYAIDPETNSSVGAVQDGASAIGYSIKARQQMLAVAGDIGTFATGYLQTTGYDWAVKFDPTAGSSISPLQSMTGQTAVIGSITAGARAPRALAYISPDMSGVTVALNYTTDLTGGLGNLTVKDPGGVETKVTATLLSATYSGGPLAVGGVYAKTSNPSGKTNEDFKEYALGASYDLSVVKLFATYQNNKSDMALGMVQGYEAKAYSFSAVAPVGPGAVVFSYAKDKLTADGGLSTGGNGYTLAYLQGLSKLTTFYVAYERVSNDTDVNVYSVDNNALAPTLKAAVTAGSATPATTAGTLKVGGSSGMLAVGLSKKF